VVDIFLLLVFLEHKGATIRAGTGIPFRCTWVYSRFLVGFVLLNHCVEFDTSRAGTATLSNHMSSTPVCSEVLVAW